MVSITSDYTLIEKLIRISKNAGDAIMDVYETEFDFDIKSNQSPVTKADLLSNKIICSSLKKITPDIPVLSEESLEIKYHERLKWKKYWLIDPLDGTKEFIKKNGDFTTNIALISENRPILGVIHVPVNNETFWGSKDIGAYHLIGDSVSNKKKISVSKQKKDNLRIVTSKSHPSGELQALLDKIEKFEIVRVGSSLKFCLIAKGEADCYPRLGPTCEWDTAAGEIIAESAGAIVVDLENNQIKYNNEDSFLNPNFIVSSNINLSERLLSIAKKIN